MRVGILGTLEVEHGGRRVEIAGGRLKTLLARLALDAGSAVSATALADAIWDAELPGDELHALQSLVSRLRRALDAGDLIEQGAGGYRLAVDAMDVDACRFTRLAAEGASRLRDGDPEGARDVLAEALGLWRGPALDDVRSSGPLGAAAGALDGLRLTARVDRAQAEIALGRAAELVPELEALAAGQPLHERVAGQLMQALYAAGRQADALALYERLRARLGEELGVPPSPDLQRVHLAVLRGDSTRPASARSNLAARLTSFVGRERELARIGAQLGEHRLLTLVGAGGAGKTRLAVELADQAAGLVRDGVWLVELAPVADGEGIATAVLDSLGLREVELIGTRAGMAGGDARSHLLEVLSDKELLLVLDNCEHLLEPVARAVDGLLGACPRARVLCTSREPLGITGEMIVPVAPLALPAGVLPPGEALTVPAVRLFADRAATASAGFSIDEHTVETVIEVCRRVDGLPLAIELAAARLRTMTLPQLAARLDDRFRLLTGGSRTAMPRQRTLQAVVDWSWELLDERERALLRRLAVFVGGVTLESAEAVCSGAAVTDAEVFDLLCALVDKSLLQRTGRDGSRYGLLETIREYGLERLEEAGELADRRTAHAHHFAALTTSAAPYLRGHDQLEWLGRLRSEHDNVLAAMRYLGEIGDARRVNQMVVSLLWFWMLSGSRQEVVTWTAFAGAVSGEADPLDRLLIEAAHALAHAIPEGTEGEDPWQVLAATLNRIEEADLSTHPLLAAVRPLLALATGRERVLELLEHSARHPDPWVRATVPFVRVQVTENEGDLEGMRLALDDALHAFTAVGDRWGLATTLSELSSLRLVTGDLDGAEHALEQTRSLMSELGASDGSRMMQLRLADVQARRGDLHAARRMLERSLEGQEGFAEETAMLKVALAHVCALQGDIDRARQLSAEALAQLGPPRMRRAEQGHIHALALNAAALVEIEACELEQARRLLPEAFAVAGATRDMPILATVGVTIATLEHRRGRDARSAELLGVAAQLRGAEDLTHPAVARLTSALQARLGDVAFGEAFARARALDREEALRRLDPARLGGGPIDAPAGDAAPLDTAAIGPQGQGHEHHQQDSHPEQRPEHL